MKRSPASKNLKELPKNPPQEMNAEVPALPRASSVMQNLNESFGMFSQLRRIDAYKNQLNTLGTKSEAAEPYKYPSAK